jgi:hypothetical protein
MTKHINLSPLQAEDRLSLVTVDDIEPALGELQRELQVRERCYPRWVEEGKLSRIDAKDRLDRIINAVEFLDLLLDKAAGKA